VITALFQKELDLMARKIFSMVWGNRKRAIDLACTLIKECYKVESKGGTTALPRIISGIDKLNKKKESD